MDVRLVNSGHGMGSFLDPPNSPQAQYEVHMWYGAHRTREADCIMSLEGALKDPDVPESIKRRIRKLFEDADMRPTEEWLSQVYGYFKNCYSPDGVDRNVSRCLIVTLAKQQPQREGERYRVGSFGEHAYGDDPPPIETSLAVIYVRHWFPDHEPRADLLIHGRWGK